MPISLRKLFTTLLWLSSLTAFAQTDSLLVQADRLLRWRAYSRAIELFEQVLKQPTTLLNGPQRAQALTQLATAYRQQGDLPSAERTLRQWASSTPAAYVRPADVLLFAQTLAQTGKLTEAQRQFERYERMERVRPAQPAAEPAPVVAAYRLEYLALNTGADEFSPAFYREGLVYASGQRGGDLWRPAAPRPATPGPADLYYVPQHQQVPSAGVWTAAGLQKKPNADLAPTAGNRPAPNDGSAAVSFAQPAGQPQWAVQAFSRSVNSRYHEGPVTFYRNDSRMVFTRNSAKPLERNPDGASHLRLFTAEWQNNAWTNLSELPFNSDAYSVGHPAMSADGKLLVFASNRPGGFGGADLYGSRWVAGSWTEPVNLGEGVNTDGQDAFPYLDELGNLYFASDGRGGLGGLDVYYVALDKPMITEVEHLPAPINSPQDDFGLITTANRQIGYLSSNRLGNDDIYRFVRTGVAADPVCQNLTLLIYDAATGQPLDSVQVSVTGSQPAQLLTQANGQVQVCLAPQEGCLFMAQHPGYQTQTVGFATYALTDGRPSRLAIGLMRQPTEPTTAKLPAPKASRHMRGLVVDEQNRPRANVVVKLWNDCTGAVVQTRTDHEGRYRFELDTLCSYRLLADDNQAVADSRNRPGVATSGRSGAPVTTLGRSGTPVGAQGSASVVGNVVASAATPPAPVTTLPALAPGDIIVASNVVFEAGRGTILPVSYGELDRWAARMRQDPSLLIEVRSHTDTRGDAVRNLELTSERAQAVVDYLVAKGVPRQQLAARGMGEAFPVNECLEGVPCADAKHTQNRRTEFFILSVQ